MNALSIVLGLGVLAVIVRSVISHQRSQQLHLGSVSERWVAEHRLSQTAAGS
jgi:hypothetical protein